MASAAAGAAGAGNESAIDLRPYGINLTLTEELTHSEYDRAVRAVEGTKTRYVVNDEKPDVLFFISREDTIKYKKIEDRNRGKFGSVSVYTDPAGKQVAIKKIEFDFSNLFVQTANFLRECIIQIILAETSRKFNRENIGVPALYKLGISKDRHKGFIISELMDTSFFRLLNTDIDGDLLDIIVPDMLLQVADILDFFQSKLYFNHRDLKTDNVMITMVGNRRIYKIIDFGMSCLMWNQLNIETTSHRFTTCFREGRDLAQLIYDLIAHHDYISERLKEWMLGLQLLAVGTSWGNSYWRFNIQSKSQAKPQRIINSIKALPFYRPIAPAAPVAPAAPAAPVAPAAAAALGSLSLSPNSSLGEFSPLELEMAIRSSVKPAGRAGAAEDENQVGLPGIFGGYKRKHKHKKTRNLRKRKGTRKSKSY